MTNNALKELNNRPIAYYPVYRKITGSTTGGILLSQLMYWFSKKDIFYKTDLEIMDETALTLDELKSAKKKIKSLSFISINRKGIPAKTYYTIDWNAYEMALEELCETPPTSSCKSHKPVGGISTNCTVEKPQSINDKSFDLDYTETTTNIIPPKAKPKNKTSYPSDDTNLKKYAISKAYASGINCPIETYESFKDHHLANGSKFKDWKRSFNLWVRNFFKFQTDNRVELLNVTGKETLKGTYDYAQEILTVQHSNRVISIPINRFFELLNDKNIFVIEKL